MPAPALHSGVDYQNRRLDEYPIRTNYPANPCASLRFNRTMVMAFGRGIL